ncbi:Arm DNA-binding domain-containing protein [Bordetella petrii]|uniref:Arm DNA-binding domain-containing protein n=1 Tax=Bordetella petrii TaxID=94624 RepID=UPI001A97C05A|nr:DUF4102 domain-containing protein [Bordetella petrii]
MPYPHSRWYLFGYQTLAPRFSGRRYPQIPLTDTAIRQTKPGPKPVKLAGGDGPYLLVTSAERDTGAGSTAMLARLGVYPDVTLAKARDRHQEARKLLAEGARPQRVQESRQAGGKAGGGKLVPGRGAGLDGRTLPPRYRTAPMPIPWPG